MIKPVFKLSILAATVALVTGCTTQQYAPDDFVVPNKVVQNTVSVPYVPDKPIVNASFGIGNDPAVVAAYNEYKKTGKAETVTTPGFVTYPYSSDFQPIVECQPLRLCVFQLEAGEKVKKVALGDTLNWKADSMLTGSGTNATTSIIIKPVSTGITTDLVISTDRRIYNIGLVSKDAADTHIVRYYYPFETLTDTVAQANAQQTEAERQGNSQSTVVSTAQLPAGTNVQVGNLNFDYKIEGARPAWSPLRVFDDGNKTFIQMPNVVSKMDLPLLYLARSKDLQMVNYRYKAPYFVVDGLFSRAWLITGKGSDQTKVEIINRKQQ